MAMKKTTALLLILCVTICFASAEALDIPTVPMQYITCEQLYEILQSGDTGNLLILDLRMEADYNNKHIIGAINADMSFAVEGDYQPCIRIMKETLTKYAGEETGCTKKIILTCYTGNRYAQAATNILSYIGGRMENVFTLQGGNSAWNNSAYKDLVEEGAAKENRALAPSDFDYSTLKGNSTLNLDEALDIVSITTPCAFDTLATDAGFTTSIDATDTKMEKNDTKEVVIRNPKGMITVQYPNGVVANGEKNWPKSSALAASLVQPDGEKSLVNYCIYDSDVLIVVFWKFSADYVQTYMDELAKSFFRDISRSESSFEGTNAKGQKVKFTSTSSFTAIRLDNK